MKSHHHHTIKTPRICPKLIKGLPRALQPLDTPNFNTQTTEDSWSLLFGGQEERGGRGRRVKVV